MNKREEIIDHLSVLGNSDLVYYWNDYCELDNRPEDRIYFMEELNDLFYDCSASDLLSALDDNFNLYDDYFYFDGYGLANSFDYPDTVVYIDEIADYIIDNDYDFDDEEIRDILNDCAA